MERFFGLDPGCTLTRQRLFQNRKGFFFAFRGQLFNRVNHFGNWDG
jgi:hypothetical protein